MKRKLELLCPAGSEQSLRAAVANGADAVYFGADAFNARVNARGLNALWAIDYCLTRGVKTYITLNTMLLERELGAALKTAESVYSAGATGVITQDLGLARLLRANFPKMELHASTQMAVHTLDGVKTCEALGFSRVVLSRECSLEDIRQITGGCSAEIEVFVHGAMCASVSGMCLVSSFIGARSGNRGLCAQPCRLPYTCGERGGYLLSMKDMCMIEHIAQLKSAGVASLKIEGRMKRPEYVGITARAYRAAIDNENENETDRKRLKQELLQIFNRGGFSTGCYFSRDLLTAPEKQEHWGVKVGRAEKGGVRLERALEAGDRLVSMEDGAELTIKNDAKAGFCALPLKGEIYRTVSSSLLKSVDIEGKNGFVPLTLRLRAITGENARLEAVLEEKRVFADGGCVQNAVNAALTEKKAREALEKLGGTPYCLADFDCDISDGAFMSASELNALRREVVEKLAKAVRREAITATIPQPELNAKKLSKTIIVCQCENVKQAERVNADEIYAQPRFLSGLADWSRFAKESKTPVYAVLPPYIPQTELRRVIDAIPDGFAGAVAASINQIAPLKERFADLRGDFWLNAANTQSITTYQSLGIERVTASAELNAAQLCELAALTDIETIVYGRLPLMNLSSCPIALTRGCMGGACSAGVAVKDRTGGEFTALPLDWGGCFTQLLNPAMLDGLRALDKLPKECAWRLCFYTETPAAVENAVKRFKNALKTGKAVPLEGSTAGHLKRGVQI